MTFPFTFPEELGGPQPIPSRETPDYTDPKNLLPALASYPELASEAAWVVGKASQQQIPTIEVTVYSAHYQPIGELNNYISLECEFKRNDMGTAEIVLMGNHPLAQYIVQNLMTTTIPIVIDVGDNLRWHGRINQYAFALQNKVQTLTLQCIDDFAYFSRMLVWPNFLLPIEIQFPKNAIFVGPAITCILTMIAEQAFRLQSGIWDLLDNLGSLNFEWETWFGTLLESNGNVEQMLLTPIVVQFVDPIFDASPWIALTGRMDKIYDLIKDTLQNYGLVLTANLWLPGDPQPPTESMGFSFIPFEVPLTQACIVVSCTDRSGVVGPTGTFIDGIMKTNVDLANSIFGNSLSPFLNPANEYFPASLGVNIAPAFGINFVPSWVIFNGDNLNGGMDTYKLSGYHPIARTVIGGGKSPQWLDDLISATLEFLIDAIEITIGFTGIPDSLLNGSFADIILAFQQMENLQRLIHLGPYAFQEYFTRTGASAYTIDEWFALMQAMFDTQGYNCIELTWQDGMPYTVGVDVFLGSLVSFTLAGQLYTDYVYSVKVKDTRKERISEVIVGNGKRNVNPIIRTVKMITGLEEVVNVLTMSS